jgi:hypothetical protein
MITPRPGGKRGRVGEMHPMGLAGHEGAFTEVAATIPREEVGSTLEFRQKNHLTARFLFGNFVLFF